MSNTIVPPSVLTPPDPTPLGTPVPIVPPAPAPAPGDEKTFTQAELDRIISERLVREGQKFSDYDQLKEAANKLTAIELANASESEKAVAAARAETTTALTKEFGLRLAKATMRAELGQRLTAADAEALVEDLNLAKFVNDAGDLDEEALRKTIDRLAPKKTVDLGQGPHGAPNTTSLDSLIAKAKAEGNFKDAIRLESQKLLDPQNPK